MQQNDYLVNTVAVHTAENDPSKIKFLFGLYLSLFGLYLVLNPRAAASIVEDGFVISASPAHGFRFGKGAYFAENAHKSHSYAPAEGEGVMRGLRAILLCRVAMGKAHLVSSSGPAAALTFCSKRLQTARPPSRNELHAPVPLAQELVIFFKDFFSTGDPDTA